jgi:hypothetical protein
MKKAPLHLALLAVVGLLSSVVASGQPIGAVDEPTPGQHVSGIVRVSGFVLDFNAIDRVDLFIDGSALPDNTADLSLPRPDVLQTFPNYANSPNAARPGFLTSFYTRSLTNGPHSLVVRATESNGSHTDFGPLTVIIDNTINQAPFGYIDTPNGDVTEVLSGSYPITGWALDDQGIDHIDFLVDGQIVASAIGRIFDPITDPQTGTYGATRPDVAAAFPDVPFALYSGFLANIETTKLLSGIHTVSVRVIDSSGDSSTIGTRTVQVNNNGAFRSTSRPCTVSPPLRRRSRRTFARRRASRPGRPDRAIRCRSSATSSKVGRSTRARRSRGARWTSSSSSSTECRSRTRSAIASNSAPP